MTTLQSFLIRKHAEFDEQDFMLGTTMDGDSETLNISKIKSFHDQSIKEALELVLEVIPKKVSPKADEYIRIALESERAPFDKGFDYGVETCREATEKVIKDMLI